MKKPTTLPEAVIIIRAHFQVAELQEWAKQSENLAVSTAHFSMGMWVRSQLVYGGSPLEQEIKATVQFIHDDDFSSIIVVALWRVLNDMPCPTIAELVQRKFNFTARQTLIWD